MLLIKFLLFVYVCNSFYVFFKYLNFLYLRAYFVKTICCNKKATNDKVSLNSFNRISFFYKLITLFLFPFKIGMFNLIIFILSNLLILPTENFGNIWDLVLKADSHIISLHYFWQLEITERSLSKIQLLLFISINSFPYIAFNKTKMTIK